HRDGQQVRAIGIQVRLHGAVAALSLCRRENRVGVDEIFGPPRIELAEVLNHVLDKGVVLRGEVMLAVADIDLIKLDLGLLLTAVETAMRRSTMPGGRHPGLPGAREVESGPPSGSTMESQVVESLRAPKDVPVTPLV